MPMPHAEFVMLTQPTSLQGLGSQRIHEGVTRFCGDGVGKYRGRMGKAEETKISNQ